MTNLSMLRLQQLLVRLCLGIIFVPHFFEKLFEGPGPRGEDIAAFKSFGFAHPELIVVLAGLCELAAFIGLTLGLWTRLAAAGTALYLVIALFAGGHDKVGYIWVNPGGGWEYPAMWAFLVASFVLSGGGQWSADRLIRNRQNLPGWLRFMSA